MMPLRVVIVFSSNLFVAKVRFVVARFDHVNSEVVGQGAG